MGPDRQHAGVEVRERGRRRERGVHLVGPLVDRAVRPRPVRRRRGHRLLARQALPHRKALAPVARELLRQRPFVHAVLRIPPCGRRQAGRGPQRHVLVFGRHREKAAVAHEPRALERRLDAVGKRLQGGVVVRRADDPGVQHAGGTEIVDVPQGAGHLLAQAKRLDAYGVRRRGPRAGAKRRVRVDRQREGAFLHQLAEAERAVRLAGTHQPLADLQGRGVDAEAIRGARDQLAAGGGRGEAHRAARLLHRVAARGVALVGRHAGARGHHRDAVEGHPQLAGRRSAPPRSWIRWPISTLPERTSTTSSGRTAIQSSTRGAAARLGLELIGASPPRASAPPAARAGGRRTGTGEARARCGPCLRPGAGSRAAAR